MATKEEAIRRVELATEGGGHVAIAIWEREDVFSKAEELGLTISDEDADAVLDEIDRHQDAEQGITWDAVEHYLEERSRR
jgi:hypothetical protein